ncbi:MAG: helix-turn-helix transcriptional regulator [Synergistes sp.]|nr:helix-turn-helix transcriptional regulator [Synergistes sp.]
MADKNIKNVINPKLKILFPVVRGLAKILGPDYEVNLHDLSMPEHSLVLCENGHVTGRTAGSPMTDFGLFMMKSEKYKDKEGVFNYVAKNSRGEQMKCSCIFIRDDDGSVIGFLCVNYDMKKALAARGIIDSLLNLNTNYVEQYGYADNGAPQSELPCSVKESFARDLEEVVSQAISTATIRAGKELKYLTKQEKINIIREFHESGFFLLKGSVERLAAEMGNSKFTVYAYIRAMQKADRENKIDR